MAKAKVQQQLHPSFGISGILEKDTRIFYHSMFTSRHIGKATDLLTAQFHEEGLDEFRFRKAILEGVFQTYSYLLSFSKPPKFFNRKNHVLEEPLSIECGLDLQQAVIGISFRLPAEADFHVEGLIEKIESPDSSDSLACWLHGLHSLSDQFIVKFQPGLQRLEVITVLKRGPAESRASTSDPSKLKLPPEVLLLTIEEVKHPSRPKEYLHLSEIPADEPEAEVLISTKKNVSGPRSQGLLGALHEKTIAIVHRLATIVKPPRKPDDYSKMSLETLEAVQLNLAQETLKLESEFADLGTGNKKNEDPGLLEFRLSRERLPENDSEKTGDLEADSKRLVHAIQVGRLNQILNQGQSHGAKLKEKIENEKLSSWIDDLFRCLTEERTYLLELAKKANLRDRIYEIDTQKKNQELKDTIREKESIIQSKANEIADMKNHVEMVTKNMSKIKAISGGLVESSQLKQKINQLQSRLTELQKENENLTKQLGSFGEKDRMLMTAKNLIDACKREIEKMKETIRKLENEVLEYKNKLGPSDHAK